MGDTGRPHTVSIIHILRSFQPTCEQTPDVDAETVAFALAKIFTNQISPVQAALLLYNLSISGLDQRPDVLAECAATMRAEAEPIKIEELREIINKRRRSIGDYNGGLCDIVGTGGDFHSTFNISTASSILCSSLLLMAKHGNRASTSKSGSADVLGALSVPGTAQTPKLDRIDPAALLSVYARTNYAFLFAPNFHKGMKHAASIRREIPTPTIFNLLGPLSNPAEALLEARVIGVKKRDLVDVYAEALRITGRKKALIVCGDEDLDEISCAGLTHCAMVTSRSQREAPNHLHQPNHTNEETDEDIQIERFTLHPTDFGLPTHPLGSVSPGLTAAKNAEILARMLSGTLEPHQEPILDFVLLNAAALFVMSGVCEGESCPFADLDTDTSGPGAETAVITERGPGGGRWKEGVRLARRAISSGRALQMLNEFVHLTHEV